MTLLKSNGLNSPVAVISAANTGITGVPCDLFFNSAHSYLNMDQNLYENKQRIVERDREQVGS